MVVENAAPIALRVLDHKPDFFQVHHRVPNETRRPNPRVPKGTRLLGHGILGSAPQTQRLPIPLSTCWWTWKKSGLGSEGVWSFILTTIYETIAFEPVLLQ